MNKNNIPLDKISLHNNSNDHLVIGYLSQEVIGILGLSLSEKNIILWKDRLKYIEKHKNDFKNIEEYIKHVELIPQIVQFPDYVGLHPNGKSIEYIKRIDKIMLVAVRIKIKGNLAFRTSYPISAEKLDEYINAGTIKKMGGKNI